MPKSDARLPPLAPAEACSLGSLAAWGRRSLAAAGPIHLREADWLLARAANVAETDIHSRPETLVTPESARVYRDWIARRAADEPYAYLIGELDFAGHLFIVTPAVLVPRPESEGVLQALARTSPPPGANLLDLGTGCGILAIAAGLERPDLKVAAGELSLAAAAVARLNARRHRIPLGLYCGDLATALGSGAAHRYAAILANPPYVATDGSIGVQESVARYEPAVALYGGPRGTDLIDRVLSETPGLLAPGGHLIMEFGFGQEEWLRGRAVALGWNPPEIDSDGHGFPRVAVLTVPK